MNLLIIFGVLIVGLGDVLPMGRDLEELRPPVYRYDDYEACNAEYDDALYCIARVVIAIDDEENVPISKRMNQESNVLNWGVCVQDCKLELSALTQAERIRINYETLDGKADKLGKRVLNCINNRLYRMYNRYSLVKVLHCDSSDDTASKSTDWVELIFVIICFASVGLAFIAWWHDKPDRPTVENEPNIVQAFSFHRNWNALFKIPAGKTHHNLRYIEGLRVFACFLVIFMHTIYQPFMLPTSTPEVLQQTSNSIWGMLLNVLIPVPVQIFLTISGFLLAVNFLEEHRQNPINKPDDICCNRLVKRFIRLLPVYVLWVLFTASFYGSMADGPIAYYTLKANSLACRKVWWTNFLFVNNIPLTNELCMGHTWYLGTDMQLHLLALVMLTIVASYTQDVKRYFIYGTIVALLIPFSLAYYYSLDPIFLFRINEVLNGALQYRWLKLFYLPSYTSYSTYLAGIIAGYAYVTISSKGYDFRFTETYQLIRFFSVFLLVLTPMVSLIWFHVDYDTTSLWPAVFATVGKFYVPLFLSICFIESIGRPKGLVRKLLSQPAFVFLGKLCYIVYIVQYSVIQWLFSHDSPDSAVDFAEVFNRFIVAVIVSFNLALVIYLCVEQPWRVYLQAKFLQPSQPSEPSQPPKPNNQRNETSPTKAKKNKKKKKKIKEA